MTGFYRNTQWHKKKDKVLYPEGQRSSLDTYGCRYACVEVHSYYVVNRVFT